MRGKKARFALLFISILCFMWAEEKKVPEQFLQRKGTSLFLDGKPFYEISFNKFDLIYLHQKTEALNLKMINKR